MSHSYRPTTPTPPAVRQAEAHRAGHLLSSQRAEERQAWHQQFRRGDLNQAPPPSKFTPRVDEQTKERLLAQRLTATASPTSLLTIDHTYSKTHNTPFNSIKQVREASWEQPLLNPDIPLHRLALVARPDLEEENEEYARKRDLEAQQEQQLAAQQQFLFRELELTGLHKRKSNRISVESKSSLRPSSSPLKRSDVPALIDAPQFSPTPVTVPPPSDVWDSTHQLSRSLTTHPYQPPPHLTAQAIRAMDAKIQLEYEAKIQERNEEKRRKQEIYDLEAQLRQDNIQRDHLLNSAFAQRDHLPQNLDEHLRYLTSSRCAPRPPSARPTCLETFRVMAPFKTTQLKHINLSGWTSMRTGLTYPAVSRPNSSRSASQRSELSSSGAATSRPSTSSRMTNRYSSRPVSGSLSHRETPHNRVASSSSGLSAYIDTLDPASRTVTPAFLTQYRSSANTPEYSPTSSPRVVSHDTCAETCALSPRSSSRLGALPAYNPGPCSPRLEGLAKPLTRYTDIKPLTHEHRDFRGLLPRKEDEEEKYPASEYYPSTSAPRVTAQKFRPDTAKSRFIRESRAVDTPEPVLEPLMTTQSRPGSPRKAATRSATDDALQSPTKQDQFRPTSPGVVKLHQNTERLPMWNRTNRLMKHLNMSLASNSANQ